jgi:hypothetical protein
MAITMTVGVCGMVGTGVVAYIDVTRKVDALVSTASDAVTKTDLRLFCLELEKSSRGVVCPGSQTVSARRPS